MNDLVNREAVLEILENCALDWPFLRSPVALATGEVRRMPAAAETTKVKEMPWADELAAEKERNKWWK